MLVKLNWEYTITVTLNLSDSKKPVMNTLKISILALAVSLLSACSREPAPFEKERAKQERETLIYAEQRRINGPAPEFGDLIWINSEPMTLKSLRGKAVFLRFWSAGCPNCEASVQTLNYLDKTYKQKGLVVIGIHHQIHKDSEKGQQNIKRSMREWGIRYPVAIDKDGKTTRLYRIDGSNWSESTLIDKNGLIQWVHPGGVLCPPPAPEFYPTDPIYTSLQTNIEAVLRE